ncbi:hypothetical protein M0Q97_12810 [Candidatus Dojkabacteria bacterium]|nr:hypothetical protein [Candidatus Dojkabacteria bacterium]
MREAVLIQDTKNILWKLPKFIRKIFLKTYYNQGMIYLGDISPNYNMTTVKWFEELKIEAFSEKSANNLSWDYFHKKYPEYGNKIKLF